MRLINECNDAIIIGCDPGPVSSALVIIFFSRTESTTVLGAWYQPNDEIDLLLPQFSNLFVCSESLPRFFAYEKCGLQNKFCGESTFATAAMGGEIRHMLRTHVDGMYAMSPSDWRHALTGVGNAKTPLIYAKECSFFVPLDSSMADPYKGTSKEPGPLWALAEAGKSVKIEGKKSKSNADHLKDALGVALGITQVTARSGKNPEIYRVK